MGVRVSRKGYRRGMVSRKGDLAGTGKTINIAFEEQSRIILQRTLPSETTFERIHSASWYQDLM